MGNAAGEFHDFDPALDIAERIRDRFAVLHRQHMGERLALLADEVQELHHHARTDLRVLRCPSRLRRLGRSHRRAHLVPACERHFGLHLARIRIEHVTEPAARSGNPLAVDEMAYFFHGCTASSGSTAGAPYNWPCRRNAANLTAFPYGSKSCRNDMSTLLCSPRPAPTHSRPRR